MTGPKGSDGKPTWGGLAKEVEYWGKWVLERVKAEIGDLYPPIPDPKAKPQEIGAKPQTVLEFAKGVQQHLKVPGGYLTPVAYLWTRIVRCKNPSCGATVPLVKQTWLCKKKSRYVALKMITPKGQKQVRFEVVEATTEKGLGFDPSVGSKGGNATCPFCGTVADVAYVKAEGCAGRMGQQMMAVVCTQQGKAGKVYLSANNLPEFILDDQAIRKRIDVLCAGTGLTVPSEPIITDAKRTHLYGLVTFGDLFTPRQILCLLVFTTIVRTAEEEMQKLRYEDESVKTIVTYAAVLVNRLADYNSTLCSWHTTGEKIGHTFGRQALPMVWDFTELAPFGHASGSPQGALEWIIGVAEAQAIQDWPAFVFRGSATALSWINTLFDAIITDPPYYDNVPYADISDFFYVWLKRTIGHLYPEHFSMEGTPKKNEAVADAIRHGGDKEKARRAYEQMMAQSFAEANRVLKPSGQMVVVYAHKTTLGWSTLVDALRQAGFIVTEAWPLDTEMKSRLRGMESAALASSIFLVARKRESAASGSYEDEVRPELERIVRERVETLWQMGITGADLVIAAVGAGLRAFTRFARVEYANGEEVPAERFLTEVEGVVLETLLEKIFGVARSGVAAVDGPSRFYVLWRYTYKAAEMDAGEAIVFTYGQQVELDGPQGLSAGRRALVEKKRDKYRLRDFTERGHHEKLGLSDPETGAPAPLIDILHRILWLVENEPRNLTPFLDEVRPDRERLRLVAQALSGTALERGNKGGGRTGGGRTDVSSVISDTPKEHSALSKLLANWRTLIENKLPLFDYGREGEKP
jgi:putative DNA methylase